MNSSRAGIVLTFTVALAAAGTVRAQDTPAQALPIRLAVDRVPVDVSIVAGDGGPVTGLTENDFTLEVDGRTRRIVSAQYVSAVSATPTAAASLPTLSTNAAGGGRLIMLVVDRGSIGPGHGRQAMERAKNFEGRSIL